MKHRRTVTLILIIVLLGICDYSAYQIYKIFSNYQASSREYEQLNQEYVAAQQQDDTAEKAFYVDHRGLKSRNSDYQGWLMADGLEVSLPVMKAADNDYYLHRTFEKEERFAGSLFLDYRCSGFDDQYVIIYGHLMKDGSMFAKIPEYQSKDHYLKYPVFQIYAENRIMTYEIFAFFKTDIAGDVYEYYVQPKEMAEQFDILKTNSYYDTGVDYQEGDRILILSTCVNAEGEERWVLCARLNNTEMTLSAS